MTWAATKRGRGAYSTWAAAGISGSVPPHSTDVFSSFDPTCAVRAQGNLHLEYKHERLSVS